MGHYYTCRLAGECSPGEEGLLLNLRPDSAQFSDTMMSALYRFICEVRCQRAKFDLVRFRFLLSRNSRERFNEAAKTTWILAPTKHLIRQFSKDLNFLIADDKFELEFSLR